MLEVRPFSFREERFCRLLADRRGTDEQREDRVMADIRAVRSGGLETLIVHARDNGWPSAAAERLQVTEEELTEARNQVSEQFLTALSLARVNLRKFHENQRRRGFIHEDGDGVRFSQRIRPVPLVGICCGASFSNLLLCAVPAQVAGVDEIVAAVPPRQDGSVDPHYLAAAKTLGIERIFRMGGAMAVAAFAHGAAPVPRVDKIVGSDGIDADMAKRFVSHLVGVDGSSGRADLAIIADSGANARFIAADMLGQAESGGGAVLFSTDRMLAEAVRIELDRMAGELPHEESLRQILRADGAIYVCRTLDDAAAAANSLAPSRVELSTRDDENLLFEIENAGAVFVGPWSGPAMDGCFAGINLVLPGPGRARAGTALGVDDFVKPVTGVDYSAVRLMKTNRHLELLALAEGDTARAAAVCQRMEALRLTP